MPRCAVTGGGIVGAALASRRRSGTVARNQDEPIEKTTKTTTTR
ncbi:hypothetical protein ACFW9V_01970 [Streptomyces hygroscopicus]